MADTGSVSEVSETCSGWEKLEALPVDRINHRTMVESEDGISEMLRDWTSVAQSKQRDMREISPGLERYNQGGWI